MAKPREYEIRPTHLPGIELRILKGKNPKVPKEVTELLLERARAYAQTDMEIERLKSLQETRKPEIVDFIEALPGLRGVRSVLEDWDLLTFDRQASPSYNSVLLRESLGPILFPEIVGEEIVASLTVPPNTITPEELQQSIHALFEAKGVPAAEIPKLCKIERHPNVDTEKLDQLVEEKRIILLDGTIKQDDPTWAIRVDLVRKEAKEIKPKKKKG